MTPIKNIRIESHSDDFSGGYTCHEIEVDEQLIKKIMAASNHIWQFNKEWGEDADIVLVTSSASCKSTTLQPYSVHVGTSGFYFEVDDENCVSAQTELIDFQAFKLQRFLLQEGDGSEGDMVWSWEEGLDDEIRDPMDFTLIYANNLEEAVQQFKSLNSIQQ